jgi:molybdenum cofactor guanylyltransferase/molybdopterin-guanine dinucleotide biosynthesis protein MobB
MTERPDNARPTGLILAGGQSRRMRAAMPEAQPDKSLADLAGMPLLGHVMQRLAPQAGRLVLNANGDPARFASFELPVIADTIPGFAGPLAGLLAGMQWSRAHSPSATHLVSVSTDVPFLPLDFVSKLRAAVTQTHAPIAIARSHSGLHPVIGLWSIALAEDLAAALAAGTRKVQDWTARHNAVPVDFPDSLVKGRAIDPFFNTNTPQDLAEARALLSAPPVIGIAGWKNSGKTTLAVRLIEHFTRRGLKVATIKRTHHVDIAAESETSDTARHRRAGAAEVILVSRHRWGPLHALREEPEPRLDDVLARLTGADLIIVEGWKSAPIAKIEVRRAAQADRRPLAPGDPTIIAIASDHSDAEGRLPHFALDDSGAIAGLIATQLALRPCKA